MATELFIIMETGDCVILGQVLIGYKFVFEYSIQPSPKSLFLCSHFCIPNITKAVQFSCISSVLHTIVL